MPRKSKRQKEPSFKAKQNEICQRLQNIQGNIKKFNRILRKSPEKHTLQVKADLSDVYLDVTSDLAIIQDLDPSFTDVDYREQLALMKKCLGHSQYDEQQSMVSERSNKTSSHRSQNSVHQAAAKIQSEQVEAEIKSLRRQAEDERKLKNLEAQVEAQKLQMRENALVDEKEKLNIKRRILESHDLDARDDIIDELENASLRDSKHAGSSVHSTPSKVKLASKNDNGKSIDSTASDMQILADSIAKAMQTSRMPVAEPPVFTGNPLDYVDWEVSFRTLVEGSCINDSDKIHYLKKYVAGKAKEAISGSFMLSTDEAYKHAKQKLKDRFGSPYAVAQAFRSKLSEWPKIKANDNEHIQRYADFLGQCLTAKAKIEELQILDDCQQNVMLMSKLPEWLSNRWKREVAQIRKANGGRYPKFEKFVEFVNSEADILNDPVMLDASTKSHKSDDNANKSNKTQEKPKSTVRSTSANVKSEKPCMFCDLSNHKTVACRKLASKTADEKKAFVQEKKLCFACLKPSHKSSECTNKATCEKCNKPHPTIMHFERSKSLPQTESAPKVPDKQMPCDEKTTSSSASATKSNKASAAKSKDASTASTQKCSTNEMPQQTTATCHDNQINTSTQLSAMVVPVWLSSIKQPSHEILVYALLDSMSDTTFVTDDAVRQLGAIGKPAMLKLTTMTCTNENIQCTLCDDLVIRGYSSHDRIPVPRAYTRHSIPLDKSHIPTSKVANSWSHLKGIASEIPDLDISQVQVGMLIGYDTSRALMPLCSLTGSSQDDPYAVKTPLGWSIVGNVGPKMKAQTYANGLCNRVTVLKNEFQVQHEPASVTFMTQEKSETHLESTRILELLQQDFDDAQTSAENEHAMSQNEKQFIRILTNNIKQDCKGNYSMPLPFKSRPLLPSNKHMALNRFNTLRKKLNQNPKYCKDYVAFMNAILEAGDAEIVPAKENHKPGEVWYIPHFGVYHPKKPDKIRIVFDCSASYEGGCLNDHLLQGPDLLNGLVGVLHRFRKGQIAVMCDIQRMFHMFKVHESDRNYLRFIWFKDETMKEVAEYRMTVHLFGATSSPGCATFGLRNLAIEKHVKNDKHSMQAKDFINNNFYVDDGLLSLDAPEEMISVLKSAVDICSQGNLRLHKFVCNDKRVLATIPTSEHAEKVKSLDLQAENSTLPVERALGVQWCVESDLFQFHVTLHDQPLTRRGILSTTASVFDPLGFIAPFILLGKQILQEMCRNGARWDDPLPANLKQDWLAWKQDLAPLKKVQIKRCLIPPNFGTIVCTELHHFSDASTQGYGQCSYIRFVNDQNEVHCTLLCGKSRVAPLKQITIPRAELQAAVLSAQMAYKLKAELRLELTKEVFWTDSKIVLGYIHNDARRFHVYVANRVQKIRDLSQPDQWNYVSSNENPADLASRGASVSQLISSCWFSGPDFLWQQKIKMPTKHDAARLRPNDPEVKANCQLIDKVANKAEAKDRLMADRFKSFSSLKSAVKGLSTLRALVKLKQSSLGTNSKHAKKSRQQLPKHSTAELEKSRMTIIRWAQQEGFSEYIKVKQGTLPKHNPLAKLDPFIDQEGILRVGGRLRLADLPFEETHPAILPKQSHIAKLVINDCHKKVEHQGKGATINEIRLAGYWIVGCSSLVSAHIHNCVICRRQRRPTETQKMADLPSERVNPSPPFTYVGCDCFGPFVVKESRKELKRYGVIFTCMASRAIHIELLDDMTTDAFINALRCFISIRGPIRELRTDQGSNFIGAANELSRAMSEGEPKIQSFANKNHFDFVTNTPYASHMGGVWERHIRTIRSVLNAILMVRGGSRLDTSALRTFLYEAMAIVNCRPITIQSTNVDTNIKTALYPNQLLTMKSKVVLPPPGEFSQEDTYSRKRWRIVQGLANMFWSRWRKEYLQSLQTRQKWTSTSPNIAKDDVVILKDDALHRNHWPLARVVETFPSKDGLVRKVKLQMANSNIDKKGKRMTSPTFLERPVHKLVLLISPKRKE